MKKLSKYFQDYTFKHKLAGVAALLIAFGMVVAGGGTNGNNWSQANLLATESPLATPAGNQNGLLAGLAAEYGSLPGGEAFLADAAKWKEIEAVKIDNTPAGVFVSLQASTGGDSLHPYFGFFRKETGRIVEVIWHGVTSGQVKDAPTEPAAGLMTIEAVNTGKVPWPTADNWKNEANDEDLILIAADGGDTVMPGQSGSFVYKTSDAVLFPHNLSKGFYIQLKGLVDDSVLPQG